MRDAQVGGRREQNHDPDEGVRNSTHMIREEGRATRRGQGKKRQRDERDGIHTRAHDRRGRKEKKGERRDVRRMEL